MRVGDPEDPATQIGAITVREQYDKIRRYCEIGVAEGAKTLFGGGSPRCAGRRVRRRDVLESDGVRGARLAPYRARGDLRSGRDLRALRDEAEAIALANASEYGLAASVWSQQHRTREPRRRARSAADRLRSTRPTRSFPGVPFGGYKQSGYGRELGMETMRLYSETKSVLTYIGEKPMDPFGV